MRRPRMSGHDTRVRPAIRERTDELGARKQRNSSHDSLDIAELLPAAVKHFGQKRKPGPVDQLQREWVLVVRFPLAEHPVARQSVHPSAGKTLTIPPPSPLLSLGGHFCYSTTAKKPDCGLMSMNAAAAAAVTSAYDDGQQS